MLSKAMHTVISALGACPGTDQPTATKPFRTAVLGQPPSKQASTCQVSLDMPWYKNMSQCRHRERWIITIVTAIDERLRLLHEALFRQYSPCSQKKFTPRKGLS